MNSLEYWDYIERIGDLNKEIDLGVGLEPVLFVCVSDNERYLVMTYDSYEGEYVFVKISNYELLNMLKNKKTMEQVFRASEKIFKTYIDTCGIMKYEEYDSSVFDANLLPRKGAYFELDSEYILEYIRKIEDENDCIEYAPTEELSILYNMNTFIDYEVGTEQALSLDYFIMSYSENSIVANVDSNKYQYNSELDKSLENRVSHECLFKIKAVA